MRCTVPLSVWLLFMLFLSAHGDVNIYEPVEIEETAKKPVMTTLHVTSDIKNRYAITTVSSTVINPSVKTGEAVFNVTLPDTAFISQFVLEFNGKVYRNTVKEKGQSTAVHAGNIAGHVKFNARDSNQISVSIKVDSQDKAVFTLTYEQLLTRKLGLYSNIITINSEEVVEDMRITVNIEEPTAITNFQVPNVAKLTKDTPKNKQVMWSPSYEDQTSQNPNGVSGQFIVRYDVDRKENPHQIVACGGYFVHYFSREDLPKLKNHFVFVLDYSGSMDGSKLIQLEDAMKVILSDLKPEDYFSIVVFHTTIQVWSPEKQFNSGTDTTLDHTYVVKATNENIQSAKDYLINYNELLATNIMGALETGLKLVDIGYEHWKQHSSSVVLYPVVFFLTDGKPIVGERKPDKIIEKTKALNTRNCPIFSFAFGYEADINFLSKLSLSNNGKARQIYEADDASKQMTDFYKTFDSPLMYDIAFSYLPDQVDNSQSTNGDFHTFFKGSEIVVAGKLKKTSIETNTAIGQFKAISTNKIELFTVQVNFVLNPEAGCLDHMKNAWAYLTIQQLMDKANALDDGEEKRKRQKEAVDLALEFSFVMPLTSLVAVMPNGTEVTVDVKMVKPDEQQPMIPAIGALG